MRGNARMVVSENHDLHMTVQDWYGGQREYLAHSAAVLASFQASRSVSVFAKSPTSLGSVDAKQLNPRTQKNKKVLCLERCLDVERATYSDHMHCSEV